MVADLHNLDQLQDLDPDLLQSEKVGDWIYVRLLSSGPDLHQIE